MTGFLNPKNVGEKKNNGPFFFCGMVYMDICYCRSFRSFAFLFIFLIQSLGERAFSSQNRGSSEEEKTWCNSVVARVVTAGENAVPVPRNASK